MNGNKWLAALSVAALVLAGTSALSTHARGQQRALAYDWMEIMDHMSLVYLDDGSGNLKKTLRISGVNVQVVNGTNDTETENGLGNLIVGYNEPGTSPDRSGSHNVVAGKDNNYRSHAGLIIGQGNDIQGAYASILGGSFNLAQGDFSTVVGGNSNSASGVQAVVSGGQGGTASGNASTVSGGAGNTASAWYATVSGGSNRSASGNYDWVAGTLLEDD